MLAAGSRSRVRSRSGGSRRHIRRAGHSTICPSWRYSVAPRIRSAVARAVPGIEAGPGADPSALDWAQLVEGLKEDWPIHELMPAGAYVK